MTNNLLARILKQLNRDHRTYFSYNESYVTHKVMNNPYYHGYSLKATENELQPYLTTYNINNYSGDIKLFVKDNIVYLTYKDSILNKSRVESFNFHTANFHTAITMMESLLQKTEQLSTLAFELKEKNLLYELQDFYRYFALDAWMSNLWLERQNG